MKRGAFQVNFSPLVQSDKDDDTLKNSLRQVSGKKIKFINGDDHRALLAKGRNSCIETTGNRKGVDQASDQPPTISIKPFSDRWSAGPLNANVEEDDVPLTARSSTSRNPT